MLAQTLHASRQRKMHENRSVKGIFDM
jgi:hypothetical protein